MRKAKEGLNFLRNNRARIIFYSGMGEPHTISEMSKNWGYKSVTYLYQKNIVDEMTQNNLIEAVTRNGQRYFRSNYDLIFDAKRLDHFFARLNEHIEIETIVREYDYEISESQLEDKLFRDFCIEKKRNLKSKIEKIRFNEQEKELLVDLWKNHVFRELFLSLEVLSELIRRDDLPENPLRLLFDLTYQVLEEIYSYIRHIEYPDTFYSPNVYIRLQDVIAPVIDALNKLGRSEIESLTRHFSPVYRAIVQKFRAYEPPSEVRFYHMEKLVEILGVTG